MLKVVFIITKVSDHVYNNLKDFCVKAQCFTRTNRFPSSHLCVHQLSPASMVIEMSHHSRNVSIAALAKRFAIVHAFQNSDQALMLLDVARNAVQSPR